MTKLSLRRAFGLVTGRAFALPYNTRGEAGSTKFSQLGIVLFYLGRGGFLQNNSFESEKSTLRRKVQRGGGPGAAAFFFFCGWPEGCGGVAGRCPQGTANQPPPILPAPRCTGSPVAGQPGVGILGFACSVGCRACWGGPTGLWSSALDPGRSHSPWLTHCAPAAPCTRVPLQARAAPPRRLK